MFLIMTGMGKLFKIPLIQNLIGLTGGAILVLMAIGIFRGMGKNQLSIDNPKTKGPLLTGILLSAGNPYFLLWWATIGLTLAGQAMQLGAFAFMIFAIVHWLCDLIWLEILSWLGFQGTSFFGPRSQERIMLICGFALLIFGIRFAFLATSSLTEMVFYGS
jgi:threonine/homoserine/homoserine lactone efflux protein